MKLLTSWKSKISKVPRKRNLIAQTINQNEPHLEIFPLLNQEKVS